MISLFFLSSNAYDKFQRDLPLLMFDLNVNMLAAFLGYYTFCAFLDLYDASCPVRP